MSDYSGYSGSSTTYTLPSGVSLSVPFAVSTTITDAEISAMFPGFEFISNPTPEDNAPPKPDNTWAYVGQFLADELNLWVLKKIGWLIIIEGAEPAGPED